MVSHSRPLAVAAAGLAREMVHGSRVRLAVAAGLNETTLGTDAVQIAAAIEEVDGPDGVVVLMDLGSAVLSSEMALELLSDPLARDRVVLSPAPIVEGLIVAAVTAAGGGDRAQVAAEAGAALLAKTAHLPVAPPVAPGAGGTTAWQPHPPPGPAGRVPARHRPEVVGVLTVLNEHGLHARPAARLVQELQGLDAEVRLTLEGHPGDPVAARSLSRVATLGARRGDRVEVQASGPQAHEAVRRLVELARRHFDETAPSTGTPALGPLKAPVEAIPPTADGLLRTSQPAAPGIAIGPARHLEETLVDLDAPDLDAKHLLGTNVSHGGEHDGSPPDVLDAGWQRVREAVEETAAEIAQVRAAAVAGAGGEEARIFDAHLALLADEEVLSDVHDRLVAGEGAARAWISVLTDLEGRWAALDDPYLRERAADVAAVARLVLRRLVGVADPRPSGRGILVAADLTPAQTASLDADLVTGVVLAAGSATSHAAILARGRGLPMVVAAGQAVLNLADGTPVALDGSTGELHLDPPADVLARFEDLARTRAARTRRDLETARQDAVTRDGVTVHVLANIGSQADAVAAAAAGAAGAGLVRTELLFLDRSVPPSTAQQQEDYLAISRSLPGRIALRTLDVGGDKPLSYLPLPVEANPFLGLRGLRLGLHRPDLLVQQLAAICAVARQVPVDVMFPMVSTLDELLEARRLLTDAAGPDGLPEGLRIGMMVEVPAAALKIASFVPHLDFVSIGTNDLTQYTLAAERGNPSVANLSDPLDPGVLLLIDTVCRVTDGRVVVTVCGEAAADEDALPLLLGLGVEELSVAPAAVPAVKAAVRSLDAGRCRGLAGRALGLADAGQVRAMVREELAELSR